MTGCPDETTLESYAARALDGERRQNMEAHLDECLECLSLLSKLAAGIANERTASAAPAIGSEALAAAREDGPLPGRRLQQGGVVGRYTIVEMLGEGGMGTVYLAHDPQLDRRVALKVLRESDLAAEPRARMTREARLMAKLAHPNIVTIFDAGEMDGRTYIAMELIEGETLARWLHARERPLAEILKRFELAGHALAAAHLAGVVHRDFKPENVLLDRGGRVAVSDFGIASSSDGHPRSSRRAAAPAEASSNTWLTQTSELLGTPGYMSPEQYEGGKVEATSDQFSFAIALFQAIYRQAPFGGNTFEERRNAVIAHDLRPLPDEVRARAPEGIHRALLRALSRYPEQRHPSMLALLGELAAKESVSPSNRPVAPRSQWTIMAGAAAAVATVLVVAAARVHRDAVTPVQPELTTASSPASTPASGDRASDRPRAERTALVFLPGDNQTGDVRFDGVVEAILRELLHGSRYLDAYGVGQLRALSRQLPADSRVDESSAASVNGGTPGAANDEAVVRAFQHAEGRRFVVVRSVVRRASAPPGSPTGQLEVQVAASEVPSGVQFPPLDRAAFSEAELVSALGQLASRLRVQLGDRDDPAEAERLVLSSSVDALHEWARGSELGQKGQDAEAAVHLRNAVATDDAFAEAHAELGRTLMSAFDQLGAQKEAQLALRRADAMSARRRMMVLAMSYGSLGRATEELAVTEQLLALWPGDVTAETLITKAAEGADQFGLALTFARRAVSDHPRFRMVRLNLLGALIETGNFAEVETEAENDVQQFPEDTTSTYAQLFVAQVLLEETDRASATCNRLEAVDEELADETRADLLFFEGRFDEAEKLLHRQIDSLVSQGHAVDAQTELLTLAELLLRRGDRRGAIAAARQIVDANLLMELFTASVLLAAGSEAEAKAAIGRWADDPAPRRREYARILSGDLLLAHGRPAAAAESYRRARAIEDEWYVHERLGTAALAQHDWKTAEVELSICIAREGEGALLLTPGVHRLGRVKEMLGEAKAEEASAGPLR